MKNMTKSAWVASAVATMFSMGAYAADQPTKGKPAKETSAAVHCAGINACKGKGECNGPNHGCAGANDCKGKGWVTVKSEKECKDKGGKVLGDEK